MINTLLLSTLMSTEQKKTQMQQKKQKNDTPKYISYLFTRRGLSTR